MSSVNDLKKSPREAKVLLRSTSFQKLCSIPYSFKIEAIQSYKEHIKTVIKLLKIATRVYVISVYFKFITTILLNGFFFKLCNQLKGKYITARDVLESARSSPFNSSYQHSKGHDVSQSRRPTVSNSLLHYKTLVQTILAYICIVYIVLQTISLLTTLWWSSNIPFGLVFLMLDLSYMGFIMLKIALN
ncbi:uncharacterized protein LOC128713297 [Anopheles marshallii]|uniref:uncharacterized protein LOC128713297 n=1 Tax=Anopheles marshallii TaxID=1521116 RepID=UPI00237AD342|nr:uncharacterized protein LOC128713297 [Anopheles marshallii]